MSRMKLFVASSSEGLPVAKALRSLLLQEVGERVEVEPWTRAFDLSATYIESLEKAVAAADFAVMVLTPDDVTTSRKKQRLSPRDNLVFELGLFMGGLGRERCFIVQEGQSDLKLPTDLLGVKSATFAKPADGVLKSVLDAPCSVIGDRVAALGPRLKLSATAREEQTAARGFCARIEGAWWDRVTAGSKTRFGFFQIEPDDTGTSVRLGGRSHDPDGTCVARWKSVLARVRPEERKLLYYWEGWHTETPNLRFHGMGEMEFEATEDPRAALRRGTKKFWDINEAHPEQTIVKSTESRRVEDDRDIATMSSGKEKDIRALVAKRAREW